jgi:hypothetical protein
MFLVFTLAAYATGLVDELLRVYLARKLSEGLGTAVTVQSLTTTIWSTADVTAIDITVADFASLGGWGSDSLTGGHSHPFVLRIDSVRARFTLASMWPGSQLRRYEICHMRGLHIYLHQDKGTLNFAFLALPLAAPDDTGLTDTVQQQQEQQQQQQQQQRTRKSLQHDAHFDAHSWHGTGTQQHTAAAAETAVAAPDRRSFRNAALSALQALKQSKGARSAGGDDSSLSATDTVIQHLRQQQQHAQQQQQQQQAPTTPRMTSLVCDAAAAAGVARPNSTGSGAYSGLKILGESFMKQFRGYTDQVRSITPAIIAVVASSTACYFMLSLAVNTIDACTV